MRKAISLALIASVALATVANPDEDAATAKANAATVRASAYEAKWKCVKRLAWKLNGDEVPLRPEAFCFAVVNCGIIKEPQEPQGLDLLFKKPATSPGGLCLRKLTK